MGSSFKARDRMAKDDVAVIGQWNAKQQYARQRLEEGKKALAFQDELDQHEQRGEQVYAVHESKSEHLKHEFHVGEEKETTYPEIRNKRDHDKTKK